MEYIIKDLPMDVRPREKLKKLGSSSLTDEELLAIILRSGTKDKNVLSVAREIIMTLGIDNIDSSAINKLKAIKGVGEVKALTLLAAIELGKRSLNKSTSKINKEVIKSSSDAYNYFKDELENSKQEKLVAIFLDTKKRVISSKVIFIGTADKSLVHPRDIFREAVDANAVSIIIMHNHPTGEVNPSMEDDIFTSKLVNIGKIVGILVIDHLIIGHNKYYSYNDRGMIKWIRINFYYLYSLL